MKNLVIVESPAKAKTIEGFLGKEYTVKSSYGHIRDLAKKEMSIDVENGYEPEYQISEDKKKLVSELQKAVKGADMVWLASDEDREGEAIAWHLQETLNLDGKKTKRIVFNEITPGAILNAIEHPRDIDMNLVDAQQARRVLDRLVGYEISPILWSKIKPALSAGRVQSVAVRLIVEREEEIKQFKSEAYYKIAVWLTTANGEKMVGEMSKRYESESAAMKVLEKLKKGKFVVGKVERKPMNKVPSAPFTTSTLQQEASRKLGYSVARTMQVAQQLYESGYITYMRTDSVNLSETAIAMAKETIGKMYGEKYAKSRRYQTKTKGAQEAHEAIRPTNIAYATIDTDVALKRLYELIWKRTVASQMSDAEVERTTVEIEVPGVEEKMRCVGKRVVFDGFFKVYSESTDEEEVEVSEGERLLPNVKEGEALTLDKAEASEHYTQHPPRYTEASLVNKLEELGIGRPSTYAPTISTILKREYVSKEDRVAEAKSTKSIQLVGGTIKKVEKAEKSVVEKGKLVPTDIGTVVNNFLLEHFNEIMDYNFTATVEKDFDEIAAGHKEWRKVIDGFYVPFHKNIKETQKNSHRNSGARYLGVDPASGKKVYAKIGRFGTLIQIGETNNEEKPKFASMKKGQSIETITLEEALGLFALPRTVGEYEGENVVVSIGKYGPYVRLADKFYSLAKSDDPYTVNLERCITLINEKRKEEAKKEAWKKSFPKSLGEYENSEVQVNVGKFGPYIIYKGENHRLPKDVLPETITFEEAVKLITAAPKSSKRKNAAKK